MENNSQEMEGTSSNEGNNTFMSPEGRFDKIKTIFENKFNLFLMLSILLFVLIRLVYSYLHYTNGFVFVNVYNSYEIANGILPGQTDVLAAHGTVGWSSLLISERFIPTSNQAIFHMLIDSSSFSLLYYPIASIIGIPIIVLLFLEISDRKKIAIFGIFLLGLEPNNSIDGGTIFGWGFLFFLEFLYCLILLQDKLNPKTDKRKTQKLLYSIPLLIVSIIGMWFSYYTITFLGIVFLVSLFMLYLLKFVVTTLKKGKRNSIRIDKKKFILIIGCLVIGSLALILYLVFDKSASIVLGLASIWELIKALFSVESLFSYFFQSFSSANLAGTIEFLIFILSSMITLSIIIVSLIKRKKLTPKFTSHLMFLFSTFIVFLFNFQVKSLIGGENAGVLRILFWCIEVVWFIILLDYIAILDQRRSISKFHLYYKKALKIIYITLILLMVVKGSILLTDDSKRIGDEQILHLTQEMLSNISENETLVTLGGISISGQIMLSCEIIGYTNVLNFYFTDFINESLVNMDIQGIRERFNLKINNSNIGPLTFNQIFLFLSYYEINNGVKGGYWDVYRNLEPTLNSLLSENLATVFFQNSEYLILIL